MAKFGVIWKILSLLKTKKKEGIFLTGLIVVGTAFDITVPFVSQRLIDTLIGFLRDGGSAPMRLLLLSAAGILVATILNRVLKSAYDYKLFTLVTNLEDALRFKAFEKYLKLHVLFHHASSSGQIIGRIDRGGSAVYSILYEIFGQNLLPPLLVFLGVLGALLIKNPLVALVVFLPLPVYILLTNRIAERIYNIEKSVNDQFEYVSKEAYDVAGNVLTVKKFSQEEEETTRQKNMQAKAREIQYSAERLWNIIENIQTLIATLGRISIILIGGYFVLKGRSTVGEFVLYVTLQNMAYTPLAQLSVIFPRLRRNMARAERLFGILDEPVFVADKKDAAILPLHYEAIEFKDVSFRYGPERKLALKNVSVRIPAGSTVALVGRSGSGKTTFINLLLRSFDPDDGEVLIDKFNLKDVYRKSLLDQVAVVPQEVDLFSRSIYENIAYGKPEVSREDVIRAAKVALAHTFIMNAEKGYETLVGERGIKLSGGERQRIGIARAILRDPKILILDEATSHLDTESERLISEATNSLIKDRTTFIIAHRLSTILKADIILVFKNGEIEAHGTHDELLGVSPTYQKLYSLQFSRV